MSTDLESPPTVHLTGLRVALVGRLAGMPKRDAQQLIRRAGGVPVEAVNSPKPETSDPQDAAASNGGLAQLIVVGEEFPLPADSSSSDLFDAATQAAIEAGDIEVIGESSFWQRMGLVDEEHHVRRLYTPAMLAELLHVPVSVVRRWHRRGLIHPAREVRRLPYFDFQEIATARRLAELLAAGASPAAIERKLAELRRYVPGVERPLAQLAVIVRGSRLLLRQGDGLVAPGGQLFFDFDTAEQAAVDGKATPAHRETISLADSLRSAASALAPEEMLHLAADLEDEGNLAAAIEAYRAHSAAAGPTASVCFAMAELLYCLGDITAARERYYAAIELDENYVEARANLGCVLAELGQRDLAVAAFEGALTLHADYADAHFHLARTLDELKHTDEAARHWQEFLRLAPESPWAAAARERLDKSMRDRSITLSST